MKNNTCTRAMVRAFGDISEVVELENVPLPPLAAGQVRVKMVYATINPSDVITLSGAYRSRISLPFVPGFEGVGVISEAHPDSPLQPGQRVLPIGSMGNWQTLKDTDAAWCFTLPDFISDLQAVCSYVNPMTAWLMLTEALTFSPDMRILINAANSAIGKMLIGLANLRGINPIVVVRKKENMNLFSEFNTEAVLNSSDVNFLQQMQSVKNSGGVNAVLDCIGGDESLIYGDVIRANGQFIHYGLLSGKPVPPQFWRSRPDIRFSNFHLRQWVHSQPREQVQARLDEVMALIRDGVIYTELGETFPLLEIDRAITALRDPDHQGKVVIDLR
ncbi:zinc-dependent alcohol dehydrogenase family protein [Candidatus Pantoea multigeneris]|uniref:Zinc-dependent alcohol dehydrogenase family protein n=1 Tax=Candidatus Pantoea multigeneris TaxID=2608357 RepID=A0ABX0R9U9_9GAMM|nr:zinc-dependent alcohol dehydrogenase family protein [Pantoea multigeneris]NIF21268.1 zinc-dependent alcohol dehydrogenase family protein [Pantoea multigeneris]